MTAPENRKSKPLVDFWRLHYRLHKQLELPLGTRFLSPRGQSLWDAYLRLRVAPGVPRLATAVVAHVYYPDMLGEILACRRAIPRSSPLHITTRPEIADEVAARLAAETDVFIHSHPNRGRDIAPFLALLNDGIFNSYDAVLKIHTKRSPQLKTGNLRRQLLFAQLAGHPLQVTRILRQFADGPVGMVGWGLNFRRNPLYWTTNRAGVDALSRAMQAPSHDRPCFFEGSMFWFRPSAFEPLRRLALTETDFEAETGQLDGCLHHALERAFGLAALAAGMTINAASGRVLVAPR